MKGFIITLVVVTVFIAIVYYLYGKGVDPKDTVVTVTDINGNEVVVSPIGEDQTTVAGDIAMTNRIQDMFKTESGTMSVGGGVPVSSGYVSAPTQGASPGSVGATGNVTVGTPTAPGVAPVTNAWIQGPQVHPVSTPTEALEPLDEFISMDIDTPSSKYPANIIGRKCKVYNKSGGIMCTGVITSQKVCDCIANMQPSKNILSMGPAPVNIGPAPFVDTIGTYTPVSLNNAGSVQDVINYLVTEGTNLSDAKTMAPKIFNNIVNARS